MDQLVWSQALFAYDKGEIITFKGESYEVVEKLGRGVFGVVYKVTSLATQKSYAIKVYHKELKKYSKLYITKIIELSQALSSMATIYDYEIKDERAILLMELNRGVDLQDRLYELSMRPWFFLRVNETSVESLLEVFRNILLAIDSIHQEGFVHKDIKANNMIIDQRSFNVKIIDPVDTLRPEGSLSDLNSHLVNFESARIGTKQITHRGIDYAQFTVLLYQFINFESFFSLDVLKEWVVYLTDQNKMNSVENKNKNLDLIYLDMNNMLKKLKDDVLKKANKKLSENYVRQLEALFLFMESTLEIDHLDKMAKLEANAKEISQKFEDGKLKSFFSLMGSKSRYRCEMLFKGAI